MVCSVFPGVPAGPGSCWLLALCLSPCPLHTAHTYPTGLGCGLASAQSPSSNSSAGIRPYVGCMTSSPAGLPCPRLLACTGPRKRPPELIVSSVRGQRHQSLLSVPHYRLDKHKGGSGLACYLPSAVPEVSWSLGCPCLTTSSTLMAAEGKPF